MPRLFTALLSLLSLSLASALPTSVTARDDEPGCQARSFSNFAWTVTDLTYRGSYTFTTPSHQNSYGYVDFTLANPALDYVATCHATSSQLTDFFYGNLAYECDVPDGKSASTTFAFNRPTGQLDVNQTWMCSDADPQFPTTINAYGTIKDTGLACTETSWQNANWTIGQIYSSREVNCGPKTCNLKPYKMTAVA